MKDEHQQQVDQLQRTVTELQRQLESPSTHHSAAANQRPSLSTAPPTNSLSYRRFMK